MRRGQSAAQTVGRAGGAGNATAPAPGCRTGPGAMLWQEAPDPPPLEITGDAEHEMAKTELCASGDERRNIVPCSWRGATKPGGHERLVDDTAFTNGISHSLQARDHYGADISSCLPALAPQQHTAQCMHLILLYASRILCYTWNLRVQRAQAPALSAGKLRPRPAKEQPATSVGLRATHYADADPSCSRRCCSFSAFWCKWYCLSRSSRLQAV